MEREVHCPSPASRHTLTILGASARAAAAAAYRAGFAPFAADMFGDTDLQTCCPSARITNYPAGLLDVLASAPDGPWMYTGALENYPRLVERMERLRPLWGNSADTLTRIRDPFAVADALKKQGLAFPLLAVDFPNLPTDGTWLKKNYHSAGGLQVARWLGKHIESDTSESYYQQYIPGRSCSAVYVAAAGQARLIGVTEQLLGDASRLEFLYAGSIGPLPLDVSRQQIFAQIGNVLADEFRLVGLFGIDAIMADDQIWTVEVNPRYTASAEVLERALNLPLIAWHAAACRDGNLPDEVRSKPGELWGKQILYASGDLTIRANFFDHLTQANQGAIWPIFADIPAIGYQIAGGHPIVTLFATDTQLESLRARLLDRAAEVEEYLYP